MSLLGTRRVLLIRNRLIGRRRQLTSTNKRCKYVRIRSDHLRKIRREPTGPRTFSTKNCVKVRFMYVCVHLPVSVGRVLSVWVLSAGCVIVALRTGVCA